MIMELLDSNLSSHTMNARTLSQDKGGSFCSQPSCFLFCWDPADRIVGDTGLTS